MAATAPNCPLRTGAGPCECDLPRCPVCGYTVHDARHHGDHLRCTGAIPAEPLDWAAIAKNRDLRPDHPDDYDDGGEP